MPQQGMRRFPVIVLVDGSEETVGVVQVTLQQGITLLQQQLQRLSPLTDFVHVGCVVMSNTTHMQRISALELFTPPQWEPHGTCHLEHGLATLQEMYTLQIIRERPGQPGDDVPLIGVLLGSPPTSAWADAVKAVHVLPDGRTPLILALALRPEIAAEIQPLTTHVFVPYHDPKYAVRATDYAHAISEYMEWFSTVVGVICQAQQAGIPVALPDLPVGITIYR